MTGSNRRPPACKAGALPAELIPQRSDIEWLVGLVGFEPTTPALSRRCSNRLSYRPAHSSLKRQARSSLAHAGSAIVRRRSPSSRSTAIFLLSTTADKCGRKNLSAFFQKGGDPAAPSDTATLLRLHPSHEPCRGNRPPCG
jgi:hypothetical protein